MGTDGSSERADSYLAFSADGHSARWAPWEAGATDGAAGPAGSDAGAAEEFSITWENEAWTAAGTVGRENVQYVIRISPTWHVRQFLLFRDLDEPDLWLGTDGNGRWGEVNGDHRPDLDGCVDIDLACTPFTNSLPIRRLPLHVGDAADITVAYIDVETLAVQPDRQRYTRLGTHRWHFEQLSTGFSQAFDVDPFGLVLDYPTMFRRIG